MPSTPTTPAPPTASYIEANLDCLRRTDPGLAGELDFAAPTPLDVQVSRAGPVTAAVEHAGRRVTLASKYDPGAEADKIIAEVDPAKHAVIVVLGFGLGYHVARIAEKLGDESALIVFEPNPSLLRATLDAVDHSDWIGRPNIMLADGRMDTGRLLARLGPNVPLLTHGVVLVSHPPTRLMHGEAIAAFSKVVTDAVSYARMHVATALVNSARTVRNVTSAIPWYAAGPNTNDLLGAAKGLPAVCVSAGPSLARNVDQLADPAVRKRVVVISAQTTLKPLLERGVRPDFVTALDYSPLSKRFYETLPPLDDGPPVTLIAEPKAHETVFDAFAEWARTSGRGVIRVTNNGFLSRLLGDAGPDIHPIKDGATVAHLSFYLAQHLGCAPIVFIGQDLGFSDGLYYSPGTAIHDVWAPELGPFNTLEMMEWQRVVRHRSMLQKFQDVNGQPIYSDEQMVTYLSQFERDFDDAPQQIIDATEGGMPKRGAQRMSLAEALNIFATRDVPALPQASPGFDLERLDKAVAKLKSRMDDVRRLRETSRQTIPILQQMLEHQRDEPRMADLFKRITPLQAEAERLDDTLSLVNELNTIGTYRRSRADRDIHHIADGERDSAFDRQRRQIDRDIDNIGWIEQACDEAMKIFEDALQRAQDVTA